MSASGSARLEANAAPPSPLLPTRTASSTGLGPASPNMVPMSPRNLLGTPEAQGPTSDFFLLMRQQGMDGEGDGGLGPPLVSPVSPVRTAANVRGRRRSVVGSLPGYDYMDDAGHESDEEGDLDSLDLDDGDDVVPAERIREPRASLTGGKPKDSPKHIETGGLDLEFLAKWQESAVRFAEKKDSNGISGPFKSGSTSSSYELNGVPQVTRFVLHSPDLANPVHSPNFSFSPALLAAQPWFWIDVLDVTDSEMVMFSKVFGLHPLTAEDIIEGRIRSGDFGYEGREKLQLYPGYFFVLFRAIDPMDDEDGEDADEIRGLNLNIAVSMGSSKSAPPWILSFHSRPLPAVAAVHRRHQMLQTYDMSAGPDWICYALLDAVCDGFAPQVRSTEMEAASIEELVGMLRKESQEEMVARINESKKRVMGLMRLLSGKPVTLKSMKRRLQSRFNELGISELALYLSDVGDNVTGMMSNLQFQEQTLARAHNSYLARIQIEISASTANSNDMTNRVTLLASIIVPFNLLTGMWGMNMRVPWQSDGNPDQDNLIPFITFACIVAAIIVTVLTWAYLKGML
ncbi:hypothetical protein DFJ74DRAFT_658637 [Hyaloraphidium curvatum]|nr:hypothetical protein DFJ74DRAFT_658637 [Hyaloraphidium curvatum]